MGDIILKQGGGGTDSDELTANKDDVLKGKTAVTNDSDGEPITGTLELTGNVSATDILAGKTGYSTNPKSKITGSMLNNGFQNGTLNCGQNKSIPAGYTSGGIITANSLESQTGGVTLADGEALSGKTFWKDGVKRTGSMVDRGSPSYTLGINGTQNLSAGRYTGGKVTQNIPVQGGSLTMPSTTNKTIVAANRYVNGNIIINGDANLKAENIKKNVTIFGVKGNHSGYVPETTDLYLRGQNLYNFEKTEGHYNIIFDSGQITIEPIGNDPVTGFTIYSQIAIDFSKYNIVKMECSIKSYGGQQDTAGHIYFSASRSLPSSHDNIYAEINATDTSYMELDISNVNAVGYLSLSSRGYYYNYIGGAIYHIWLS